MAGEKVPEKSHSSSSLKPKLNLTQGFIAPFLGSNLELYSTAGARVAALSPSISTGGGTGFKVYPEFDTLGDGGENTP